MWILGHRTSLALTVGLGACFLVVLAVVGTPHATLAAGEESAPKMSQYAPIADLAAEAEAIITEIEAGVANPQEFQQTSTRIMHKAIVLAILAQAVAESDESAPWKPTAGLIRDAALEMSKTDDYEAAKAAFARIKDLHQAGEPNQVAAEKQLTDVAALGDVMKEVTSRNTNLRRALRKNRFERSREDAARSASVLAVLATIAREDTHEVEKDEDIPEWKGYADQLRDGMADLAKAFRGGDFTKSRKAYLAVSKACSGCHKKFRPDEEF